jgi:polyisoprenoid-binding protein YceI
MKKIVSFAIVALLSTSLFAQTKWNVDKVHSNVKFSVSHLVISEVEGNFKVYDGSIVAPKPDFTGSQVDFKVDVNSINTDNEMRDKHLKSDDFFNSEKFPTMSFTSTAFKKVSGNKYALYGNLTIRNITKPVKFDVVYGGTVKDAYGNIKSGFKASTVINRFDYNLKWNALTEAGGAAVGKDVTLDLKLEFAQAKS